MNKITLLTLIISSFTLDNYAEEDKYYSDSISTKKSIQLKQKNNWYETMQIRGYGHIRYNRLLETNPKLKCSQCDASWGEGGGIFIRRLRIAFSGYAHKRLYYYVQPDLAASVSGNSQNFLQLRDAYFDYMFDNEERFRIRVGQTKVPYGFENLVSSRNRLALDRADALNSAVSNERDLGAIFFWTPPKIKNLLDSLTKNNLKGTGNYGLLALGIFNGQGANKPELNLNKQIMARISYPFRISKTQIMEFGIQAYTGKVVLPKISDSINLNNPLSEYKDNRAGVSFALYPKPIGIFAEYNIGNGPEYDNDSNSIIVKKLSGGYALFLYQLKYKEQVIVPYFRLQQYTGGKKFELDARSYSVEEYEAGIEWSPINNLELTACYIISKRRFEDAVKTNNLQEGKLLRLQLQFSF